MFFFMFLLSIWVVAYGVAKQGILIHNDNRLGWILRGAVYEPYLIIFGDFPKYIDSKPIHFFLFSLIWITTWCESSREQLPVSSAETDFDINSCTINGSDPLKPKCPVLNESQTPAFPEWLTIIMLCVYLLFANILLLNLLIAIFKWVLIIFLSDEDDPLLPDLHPVFLHFLSFYLSLASHSRKCRTTPTGYGSFKDTSWSKSTTAARRPLLPSSCSVIFISSSGT